MIRYQFRPSLVDHCQNTVVVRPFYNNLEHDLSAVISRLSRFQFAKVQNDVNRVVRFKFHKGFQREYMDWERLQMHRKQIGLLAIARVRHDTAFDTKELEKIQHRFGNIRSQYKKDIIDARCIILCSKAPSIESDQSVFFLEDHDDGESLHFTEFVYDFMSSLFVILESKRIEKINEKLEYMTLPTAPIEQEQDGTESAAKIPKQKILGRNRKLLADLYLLCGMYQEALYHYGHSSEYLRSVGDYLWMGASLEGLCATSIIMTKIEVPSVDPKFILKGSTNSNLSHGDLNPEEDKSKIYVPLTDNEILLKYREVLGCYSKFQTGHVALEAHLKFTKLLLSMKRVLEACEVIQNVLTLKIGYNAYERVELCRVLSLKFDQANLKRKAAFFRIRAAMHLVQQNGPSEAALRSANSSLHNASNALLLNLGTHKRSINDSQTGWPSLQLHVLLEMLTTSKRLGLTMNCIRLLCYILENYSGILIESKKAELIDQLEEYHLKVEDAKDENKQDEEVEMIRPLPIVRDFKPRVLPNHLRPKKQEPESAHGGPFIVPPISFKARRKKVEEEVIWVCGDVAEVGMTVDNPLPAEIKVKNMILITEGIHFEAFPATLALPAESGAFPFMLLGTPQTSGQLVIKGYKVDVFGIENEVMLNEPISIKVVPSLPLVNLHCTLEAATPDYSTKMDDEDYQTLFASLSTYRGHSTSTILTIENIGKLTINSISVKLKKATDNAIAFNEDSINSILPLEPGKSTEVGLTMMPRDAWKSHSTANTIKSSLAISYADEKLKDGGYGREIAFTVSMKVMASISVENYEVYEFKKHPSCCCLCFDVINHASINMKFQVCIRETKDVKPNYGCPNETEASLQAKSRKRIGVHLPRCLVEVPNLRMKGRVENAYCKAIKEAIQLKWTLSDSRFTGVTYLENLKFNAEMVNVVKPKHIGMSIAINNKKLSEGEDISTSVCQMMNVHLQLTNDLEFDENDTNYLRDLYLCIKPHQGEGYVLPSSQVLFAHCGTLKKSIKKLSPGEVLDHTCGLFFLYPGEYAVDITCKMQASLSGMSEGRDRALAVTDDHIGINATDGGREGHEEMELLADGTVVCAKRDSCCGTNRNTLQKPALNHWARRFLIHVA